MKKGFVPARATIAELESKAEELEKLAAESEQSRADELRKEAKDLRKLEDSLKHCHILTVPHFRLLLVEVGLLTFVYSPGH